KNLARGLTKLGLKYHVPGDQDLSAGMDFYFDVVKENDWIVFSANAGEKFTVAKKSWIQFNKGTHQFFIIAITDPKIIQDEFQNYISDPEVALAKTIKEIEKSGFDAKNEFHRLILLSHSGYEKDEYWAKKFPNINWIIGAHSQKFTRTPLLEGKTKIVQALSQ